MIKMKVETRTGRSFGRRLSYHNTSLILFGLVAVVVAVKVVVVVVVAGVVAMMVVGKKSSSRRWQEMSSRV